MEMWGNKLLLLAGSIPTGQRFEKEGELRNASLTLNCHLFYRKQDALTSVDI